MWLDDALPTVILKILKLKMNENTFLKSPGYSPDLETAVVKRRQQVLWCDLSLKEHQQKYTEFLTEI